MTTPVSGAISFLDLANEYQGPYGFQRYSLSMADVYNSANLVTGTVIIPATSIPVAGNVILWSEDFTTTWAGNNATAVANQTTAPDGTLTADKLVHNSGTDSYLQQSEVGLAPSTTYIHSLYLKGDGSSVGRVVAIVDWDNNNRVGATSLTLTADWQRLSISFVPNAPFGKNIRIQTNGIAGTSAGIGAVANMLAGQAVFIWGYQITTGSTLQAYNEYSRTTSTARTAGETINAFSTSITTSVAARGAISMSQFYGITGPASGAAAAARVTITINVPSTTFTSNLDLYKLALGRGYTTGTTDVVLNIGTGAIVGSAGSSVVDSVTITSSTANNYYATGNMIPNSANMSDTARWANGGSTIFTTAESVIFGNYGVRSPNGTTTGILAATLTVVTGNNYIETNTNIASASTFYSAGVWVRGFGSSIGQKVSLRISFNPNGSTSVTLTANWQRMQTQLYAAASNFRPILFLNGGTATNTYTNNMLLTNQTVFAWGFQMTTSINGTTGINVNLQYVETSTGSIPGTFQSGTHNIFTTSETLVTSYAVYVPSRFNAADTVRIVNNGTIVGESGKGGQGGSGAPAPAFGYPTPSAGKVGGRGGDALGVFRPVIIDNTGTIAGGGGGGGGGGAGPGTTPKGAGTTYSGGSGGGGAGADSNPGFVDINASLPGTAPAPSPASSYALGTPPAQASFTAGTGGIRNIGATSTATPGANGGALGTTGSTSTASPLGGAQPGGPPGHYVVGSPLVTWVTTGTRSGTVG